MDDADIASNTEELDRAEAMRAARRVIPIYLDCVDCSGITQSHAKAHCGDYAACLADWEKTQKLQRIVGNDLV